VPPFYGQYSLQPTATNLTFNADTLFPDLANIPQFPAPFSTSTNNRTAYTTQWNANVQRTFGASYVVEVAYTGSRNRHEHKRFNINQATPGTTPIETRVPYPAFQSAILYSSDAGHGTFKGLSVRLDKRYATGLFLTASYQVSRAMDNGSGEVEANDTSIATNPDLDWGLSRYDQRHRSAFSYGYDLADNRTVEQIDSVRRESSYNAVNQLVAFSNSPISSVAYAWDAENRLAAITNGTHTSEFSYDGLGRRTRIVEKDNGSVTNDRQYL